MQRSLTIKNKPESLSSIQKLINLILKIKRSCTGKAHFISNEILMDGYKIKSSFENT